MAAVRDDMIGSLVPLLRGDGATSVVALNRRPISGLRLAITDGMGVQRLYSTARTNLAKQSQTFQTTWANNGSAIITADQAVAPDGTLTADLLKDAGSSASYLSTLPAVASGTVMTYSVWMKNIDSLNSIIYIRSTADAGKVIATWTGSNITALTNQASPISSKATNCGGGWWRLELTVTTTELNQAFRIYPAGGGSGGKSIYLWGAQAETGLVATPYIPTTTVAAAKTDYAVSGDTVTLTNPLPVGSTLSRKLFDQFGVVI